MSSILALDIGEKRVGVAVAEAPVFIAHSLPTLDAEDSLAQMVQNLLKENDVSTVVVGYPRNQAGDATKQSHYVEEVVENLNLPNLVKLAWQDESLTSVKAEAELEKRGKPYQKADIDALAATYILEDYLQVNR